MIGSLGCTGYTGTLVTSYFAREVHHTTYPYLLAARSAVRVAETRLRVGTPDRVESMIVDVDDNTSLSEFVARCTVVLNCVGPFDRHGEKVISTCLRLRTHYVDISGEPAFLFRMIDRFDSEAGGKALRVILCAGFDSVPADCGVLYTEELLGASQPRTVRGSLHVKGPGSLSSGSLRGISHGTYASLLRSFGSGSPGRGAFFQKEARGIVYDRRRHRWLMRFPVADAHVVRRSHRILQSEGLSYSHFLELDSLFGMTRLIFLMSALLLVSRLPLLRRTLTRLKSAGTGPSEETRRASSFEMTFEGRNHRGDVVTTRVRGLYLHSPGSSST